MKTILLILIMFFAVNLAEAKNERPVKKEGQSLERYHKKLKKYYEKKHRKQKKDYRAYRKRR